MQVVRALRPPAWLSFSGSSWSKLVSVFSRVELSFENRPESVFRCKLQILIWDPFLGYQCCNIVNEKSIETRIECFRRSMYCHISIAYLQIQSKAPLCFINFPGESVHINSMATSQEQHISFRGSTRWLRIKAAGNLQLPLDWQASQLRPFG